MRLDVEVKHLFMLPFGVSIWYIPSTNEAVAKVFFGCGVVSLSVMYAFLELKITLPYCVVRVCTETRLVVICGDVTACGIWRVLLFVVIVVGPVWVIGTVCDAVVVEVGISVGFMSGVGLARCVGLAPLSR